MGEPLHQTVEFVVQHSRDCCRDSFIDVFEEVKSKNRVFC
jgi:hypothetical protein